MKILFTAFKGKNNSSKVLLDMINVNMDNKLYLTNSFKTSEKELEKVLLNKKYDLVISIGQAPIPKNTIKIEIFGRCGNIVLKSNYNYSDLEKYLKSKNYNVIVSKNAGKYLCNNIYYYGLKYIYERKLETDMIFIHIPKLKEINNMNELTSILNDFF